VADRVGIRDIGHHTGRVVSGGAKLCYGSVQPIRFDVGQHQLHPGLGEPFRHRQAKTAGRTGDYRYSVLQVLHISSSPIRVQT
jgi:hypothetical protein